jgi:hypothetical protein
MILKFLRDIQGQDRNEKGIALPLRLYKKDEEVEVGQELAQVFLKLKAAKEVKGKEKNPMPEEKGEKEKEEKEEIPMPEEKEEIKKNPMLDEKKEKKKFN